MSITLAATNLPSAVASWRDQIARLKKLIYTGLFTFFAVLNAVPALACDVEADVAKAPNCKEAFEFMKSCSSAGISDAWALEGIREKCEPQFLPKLSVQGRRAYQRDIERCVNKYKGMRGSMYGSMSAFCQAEVIVRRATRR